MGKSNPQYNKIYVELNPERINAHRNIESFYKFYQTRQKNKAASEIERILYCVHQGQKFEGISDYMIQKYKERKEYNTQRSQRTQKHNEHKEYKEYKEHKEYKEYKEQKEYMEYKEQDEYAEYGEYREHKEY